MEWGEVALPSGEGQGLGNGGPRALLHFYRDPPKKVGLTSSRREQFR